jgi:hypothetical protein
MMIVSTLKKIFETIHCAGHIIMESLEEREFKREILDCRWCPGRDLFAMLVDNGDLVVLRLSWAKVWSFMPAKGSITCFCWRPDGNVSQNAKCYGLWDAGCLHQHCKTNADHAQTILPL